MSSLFITGASIPQPMMELQTKIYRAAMFERPIELTPLLISILS
jgi:hypothetical protein